MGKQYITRKTPGFTIVELTVVIVVIAILASITVIVYRVVLTNSRSQAVSSDLQETNAKITRYRSDKGTYPPDQTEFNTLQKSNTSGDTTLTYTFNNTTRQYCLAATGHGVTFHLQSTNPKVESGPCA